MSTTNLFDAFPDPLVACADPQPNIRGSVTLHCLTSGCSVSSVNIRFDAANAELALEPRCPGCQAPLPLCHLTAASREEPATGQKSRPKGGGWRW